MNSMKTVASAIAILIAAPVTASAACSPSISPITDGVSIDVAGCHLQIQNPAIIPTVTGGGIEVIVRDPLTGEIGTDNGNITGELDRQIGVDSEQDARLDKHKQKIVALKAENQDQWNHIGSLETVQTQHGQRLDAHDALLSQHAATLGAHGKRLDKHEKGLAIAMSLPDLYLTEKERFSIAGNLGGFGDETGIGAGVAVRLDQNWSLNGKLGSDTEFKEFGWSVGARAGF